MLFSRSQTLTHAETDLGSILLRLGACTDDDLAHAREVQLAHRGDPRPLLGQVMVQQGIITRKVLDDALELQGKMRAPNANQASIVLDIARRRAGIDMRAVVAAVVAAGT